jgi:hypothetical protein
MSSIFYKLKPQFTNFSLELLCENPHDKALEIISNNLNKLDERKWHYLCNNPNDKALEIISNNLNKIDEYNCWRSLCYNTNSKVIPIIINNINKLDDHCWWVLCCFNNNSNIYEIIKDNISKLNNKCWQELCKKNSSVIIEIISNNLDKLDVKCWKKLCSNYYAYDIIKKYIFENIFINSLNKLIKKKELLNDVYVINDKYKLDNKTDNVPYWQELCCNTNPEIIQFIYDNMNYLIKTKLILYSDKKDFYNYTCLEYLYTNSNIDIYKIFNIVKEHNIDYLHIRLLRALCENENIDILNNIVEKELVKRNKITNDDWECFCWCHLCDNPKANHIIYKHFNIFMNSPYDFNGLWSILENPDDKIVDKIIENIDVLLFTPINESHGIEALLFNTNERIINILIEKKDTILQKLDYNYEYRWLYKQPHIFTYDYDEIKKYKLDLHNELHLYFMKTN